MKKFKVVCFTLLAASAIASTFYFTTAKAANSKILILLLRQKRLPQKNSLLFCHKTTNHLPLTFKYLSIRSSRNFTIPLL